MKLAVRPYEKRDYARVLDICIAAFEPIHRAFEQALGMRIIKLQYQDWKEQYAETLPKISARDRDRKAHVVELDGAVVGFIVTVMDARRKTGEIGLNAVDPKLQGRGIGRAMYEFALNNLKERGAEMPASGPAGMPPMHRREEPMKRLDSTRQFPACISSKCCSDARSRHLAALSRRGELASQAAPSPSRGSARRWSRCAEPWRNAAARPCVPRPRSRPSSRSRDVRKHR